MKCELLVVGSGRMGRELGVFFLRRGLAVGFRSRDVARLEALRRHVGRALRHDPGLAGAGLDAAQFFGAGEPLPDADLVIESIEEALPSKRALFEQLAARYPAWVPLLSNSSSLVPSSIHSRCQGLHFFQPIERCGFVEWIRPEAAVAEVSAKVEALLERHRLHPIRQTEAQAFAVNRLLLPVQAACFRALRDGAPAAAVDEASCSPRLPLGQLAMIDAIGLDVVAAAVESYRGRMTPTQSEALEPLSAGLARLLEQGKRGRKNGDGLLVGRPLPWPERPAALPAGLGAELERLFADSCAQALSAGELSLSDLQRVLAGLFGGGGDR